MADVSVLAILSDKQVRSAKQQIGRFLVYLPLVDETQSRGQCELTKHHDSRNKRGAQNENLVQNKVAVPQTISLLMVGLCSTREHRGIHLR